MIANESMWSGVRFSLGFEFDGGSPVVRISVVCP